MTKQHDLERRENTLTDTDLERIGDTFDRRVAGIFENIGYDISDAAERGKIRLDHVWVRDLRTGTEKVKVGALISVLGTLGASVLYAIFVGAKALLGVALTVAK